MTSRGVLVVALVVGVGLAASGCARAVNTLVPTGGIEFVPLPFADEFVSSQVTEVHFSVALRHSAYVKSARRGSLCIWDGASVNPYSNDCISRHRLTGGGAVYIRHGIDCDWLLFQWDGRDLRIPVPPTLHPETVFEVASEGCLVARTEFDRTRDGVLIGEICLPDGGEPVVVEWERTDRSWSPPTTWAENDGITRLSDSGESFTAEYVSAGASIRAVRTFDGQGRTLDDVEEFTTGDGVTRRLVTEFGRSEDGEMQTMTRTTSDDNPVQFRVYHSRRRVSFSVAEVKDLRQHFRMLM